MKYSTRVKGAKFTARLLAEIIGAVAGAVVALILTALDAPTWAWVVISLVAWSYVTHSIMKGVRQSPDMGRFYR